MDLCSQLNDVVRRTSPYHEAVALIAETRLDAGVLEAEEVLVDDELLVVWGKELFLLEAVAFGAVSVIQGSDLFLQGHT